MVVACAGTDHALAVAGRGLGEHGSVAAVVGPVGVSLRASSRAALHNRLKRQLNEADSPKSGQTSCAEDGREGGWALAATANLCKCHEVQPYSACTVDCQAGPSPV